MLDALSYLALIAPTIVSCLVAYSAWKRNKRASIAFQYRIADVWGATLGLIPTYTVFVVALQRNFAGHEWGALACLLMPSWFGMLTARLFLQFHDSDRSCNAALSVAIILFGAFLGIVGTIAFWILLSVLMIAIGQWQLP
jgi:hypothetical protein